MKYFPSWDNDDLMAGIWLLVYRILGFVAHGVVFMAGRWPWFLGPRRSQFIGDRLARVLKAPPKQKPRLWIHAASVGEVKMIPPLVSRFADHGFELILTATTPSGRLALDSVTGSIWRGILPLDTRAPVRRFLDAMDPSGILLLETELWPTLVHQAAGRHIPIMMANARMSSKGRRRYGFVKSLIRGLLVRISLCLARSKEDLNRFIELGLPVERGRVTGDLKRDTSIEKPPEPNERLLGPLGPDDRVVVAGSVHPGEARILGRAFQTLRKKFSNLRMVVVPRHLDRLKKIEETFLAEGMQGSRCSESTEWGGAGLLFWDRYGDLPRLFLECHVGFIGGSLVPHGGHNPLEAARAGIPILFGPHMENFQATAESLTKSGGALRVMGVEDLVAQLDALVSDDDLRNQIGSRAKKEADRDRGAADRIVHAVSEVLS